MRLSIILVFLAGVIGPQLVRADVNVKTCAAEPDTTIIAYGDLVNCEINPTSDSDLFRFTGQQGDKVDIFVLRYTGNADQCFRVIQPSGTIGSYTCTGASFGARFPSVGANVTLTESGVYTIQVIDGGSDETYSYGLTLARVVPAPANAVPIARFGAVLSGDITPRGDSDFYTFTGVAGDTVPITLSRVSGNADQCFRIIQPDGNIGNYTCVGASFGARFVSVSADIKLTQSGRHTIQIADGSYDETFPYNLEVQCLVGACPSQNATPKPIDVSPGSGSAASQAVVFTFTDPDGWQDLDVVNILINSFLDGRQACYLAYSRTLNVLYLVNDSGTALSPGLQFNGSGSLTNGQCAISGAGSSAAGTANTLTLMLNITFSAAFAGNKVVYLAARDSLQNNSGWQALGTWGVPNTATSPTAAVSVSPGRGSGSSRAFTFTFSDTKGSQDLGVVNVLINDFLDGRNGCYLAYSRPLNVLYLVNDSGTSLGAGLSMNGSGAINNSQCTISGTGSSVTSSGNTLTLVLNASFSSIFNGNRVIYMAARDSTDANNSGWQALGTWTVQ